MRGLSWIFWRNLTALSRHRTVLITQPLTLHTRLANAWNRSTPHFSAVWTELLTRVPLASAVGRLSCNSLCTRDVVTSESRRDVRNPSAIVLRAIARSQCWIIYIYLMHWPLIWSITFFLPLLLHKIIHQTYWLYNPFHWWISTRGWGIFTSELTSLIAFEKKGENNISITELILWLQYVLVIELALFYMSHGAHYGTLTTFLWIVNVGLGRRKWQCRHN